jgi:glycosyltransferase involved in cell wall biosynthesis
MEVIECHADIWKEIVDKSQISSFKNRLKKLSSWFLSYPLLIWRYMLLPSHDAVLVCYLGPVDILALKLFARLRGVPVIWDAFLSLYDTVVNDRQMVSRRSPLAWFLYSLEWLSCRAADGMFLDTEAHARYFEQFFRLPIGHVGRVFVGAETEAFPALREAVKEDGGKRPFTVLFYGQYIPLHGIDTIVKATQRAEIIGEQIRWVLIGRGQESRRIDGLIRDLGVTTIERISWAPYEELIEWILNADVCLGIFGTTAKASRVIPNKVYQILSANRPLITADTPAIRELLVESDHIKLIPPGDPEKLAQAVIGMKKTNSKVVSGGKLEVQTNKVIGPAEVGIQLFEEVTKTLSARK